MSAPSSKRYKVACPQKRGTQGFGPPRRVSQVDSLDWEAILFRELGQAKLDRPAEFFGAEPPRDMKMPVQRASAPCLMKPNYAQVCSSFAAFAPLPSTGGRKVRYPFAARRALRRAPLTRRPVPRSSQPSFVQVGLCSVPLDGAGAALEMLHAAARQGSADAMFQLGKCYQALGAYRSSEAEYQRHMQVSVNWYAAAVEQGHLEAAFQLGVAFYKGIGVAKQNFTKAVAMFEMGAKDNLKEAMFHLALCYLCGHGARQDKPRAVQWMKEAARRGHPDANHVLAVLFASGIGTNKDVSMASVYWRRALDSMWRRGLPLPQVK